MYKYMFLLSTILSIVFFHWGCFDITFKENEKRFEINVDSFSIIEYFDTITSQKFQEFYYCYYELKTSSFGSLETYFNENKTDSCLKKYGSEFLNDSNLVDVLVIDNYFIHSILLDSTNSWELAVKQKIHLTSEERNGFKYDLVLHYPYYIIKNDSMQIGGNILLGLLVSSSHKPICLQQKSESYSNKKKDYFYLNVMTKDIPQKLEKYLNTKGVYFIDNPKRKREVIL